MRVIKDIELETQIYTDLTKLNIPVDFKLVFKSYSKAYWGRYFIDKKVIVIYIEDEYSQRYSYSKILLTALHEAIHHYQHHHDSKYKRIRGVMHNPAFFKLYTKYCALLDLPCEDLE